MKGPDLARLLSAPDDSGAALAEVIRAAHGGGRLPPARNGNGAAPTPAEFMASGAPGSRPWDDIAGTLAGGRNNGIMKLACSLRETTSLSEDEAIDQMYQAVWPLVNQGQGGHEFPESEFEEVIRAVWREYPGAAEHAREAASAAADLQANPLPRVALELTDAYITDRVAGILHGRFCWAPGLGWMKWDGRCWTPVDTSAIWDEVRKYFIWLHWAAATTGGADQALLARLTALLSKARISAVADLARGHDLIRREAADFDAHPDMINTPSGVVDLRTGEVTAHRAELMLTKITSGSYVRGYTHPDWEQALTALGRAERDWFRLRVGQAITGYPPSDGIMPVMQGSGENGKSCLTTDGPVKALGGYADMASHKLIASQRASASEHSTEMADLRGQRLLIGEELSEGRAIDVTALKRIQDVGRIKARYVHKDNITFDASHTLFITTNYIPVITETDHGTWRRLALLAFPYTYHKAGGELLTETDRRGDPGLKGRIRYNRDGQHDAIVTWAVEGARSWYEAGRVSAPVTARVAEDTRGWRKQADHILGFWDEFLTGDPGAPGGHPPCIRASHLLAVFNAWMGRNGHASWVNQTFAMRFGAHEVTAANGVRHEVTKRLRNLSWYTESDLFVPADPPVAQVRAWTGVRFKTRGDLGKQGPGDEGDGPETNPLVKDSLESFHSGPSPSSPGPSGAACFDLETADASELFTYTQSDETGFVRLAGLTAPGTPPAIMTGPELVPLLDAAAQVTGHNILGFDLIALAWHCGADYDRLAAKAWDTELVARQADPPRSRETHSADAYDLDSVAERLEVRGKTDSAARLKRKFGGYDKIPLDDPEYRAYLEGDLRATAAVYEAMSERYPPDPYVSREHKLAAIAGRMTLNGFVVDQGLLAERLAGGQAGKRECLRLLHDGWGLPLTRTVTRGRGKAKAESEEEVTSPLSTTAGREWLAELWDRSGLEDPPRTAKSLLSVGIDDLKAVEARRPDLAPVCRLMEAVTGTRTVYQTASDCLAPDGRVHPGVSMRQASGRWSVTNPGLTVFGKRGGRHVERDIFLPDPGHVLLSFDLSQVDMRAMAGHSQDPSYMALFAPGRDAHEEIAQQVGLDRQSAKAIGHGWNYGLGAKRMIANGLDPGKVAAFTAGMEQRFPVLIAWREQIRAAGAAGEILNNGFGRRMRCDPARAYTVAPALMGQGGARDIMCECLLRLPPSIYPMLRTMVHDEILLSVPKDQVMDVIPVVQNAMTWEWRGVPITCDFSFGANWGECSGH